MKKTFILSLMAIATIFAFTSCDDDKDVTASSVPEEITASFKAMFPTATNVSWEKKKNYYVADFDENRIDTDAWFETDGKWTMTVSDYWENTSVLPEAVAKILESEEYSKYIVDDIELYKRTTDTFYVIELDGKNIKDIDLIISPEGELINTIPESKDYTIYPTTDLSKL